MNTIVTSAHIEHAAAFAAATGKLGIVLLGELRVDYRGAPVGPLSRKTKALLAYLVLSDVGLHSREHLVGLFWSESDEMRARASLRQSIKELSDSLKSAGFSGLIVDKQHVGINRDLVWSDVQQVLDAALDGLCDPLLLQRRQIADTLLKDLDGVDNAFRAFVLAKRQTFSDMLTRALERMLPVEGDETLLDRTDVAQALLNLDPTHEPACRHLMRVRFARGDVAGALKVYKALWDLLERHYDIEPSAETKALLVAIRNAPAEEATRSLPACVSPRSEHFLEKRFVTQRLFLSVGQFDGTSVPEELRYCIDGFRHELIGTLARFREWSVRNIAIGSPAGDRLPVEGSEFLIDGTAFAEGDRLNLLVTLSDRSTGICHWSHDYSFAIGETAVSRRAIVRRIANALNVSISAQRLQRLADTEDLPHDLHEAWLRGQSMILQIEPDRWEQALDLLQTLQQAAPRFSPALSSMVQILNSKHIAFAGVYRSKSEHYHALILAQRAVALDPLDSRAHLSLAWAHQLVSQTEQATFHADIAIDLNDTDPWTLMSAAQILSYCGAHGRAIELATKSMRLTPIPSPIQRSYASAIFFLAKRYVEAAGFAVGGLDQAPGFSVWPCAALHFLGRTSEAKTHFAALIERLQAVWPQQVPWSAHAVGRWLIHMFPIAVPRDWERLKIGLAAAGASIDGENFGDW